MPLKMDVDLQITLMVSCLFRILALRAGGGLECAKACNIFKKQVHASGSIEITYSGIIVRIG